MVDAVLNMAVTIIGDIVRRVGDIVQKEGQYLFGVKDQVEEIQDELRRIKCFLKDASEKHVTNALGHHLIREFKILAEDMEDLVENYALKAASLEKGVGNGVEQISLKRLTSSLSFSKSESRRKTAREVARVKTKLLNLAASLQSYGRASINELGESSRGNDAEQEQWRRMSYPHWVDDDFVGMDDSVEKLVSLVLVNVDGQSSLPRHVGQPVSIWGMGGIGKTTVAKIVYNDDRVNRNFQGFAWICVSQVCEPLRVLQDLLKQLLTGKERETIMSMGFQDLVKRLYKVQQEKKCLVVLDDMWNMADWEILKYAFPIGKKGIVGSRLLVTTRIKEVAKMGHVHELQYLNQDDGWKLLRKKAIPRDENDEEIEVDFEMEKAGRNMVKKSGGLPLAIVVLGGILKTRYTVSDWNTVSRTFVSYLIGTGEGFGTGCVEQVLQLSYDNLPAHLKKCFLYFGEYREDEEIYLYSLYQKWIVGGVMSTNDQREGETMVDVAERYLEDLAQRSMVKVELRPTTMRFRDLKFRSCVLHDLMRDLCLAKAKEEEFSSIIKIKSNGHELVSSSSTSLPVDSYPRRLAIYCYGKKVTPDLEQFLGSIDTQRTRSISLTTTNVRIEFPPSIGNCERLRDLELVGIKFLNEKLPKTITSLVHLRYLKLRRCILKKLPTSIGNLGYLQILNVSLLNEDDELIIPNIFKKLTQLTNINLPLHTRVKNNQMLQLDGLNKLEDLEGVDTCHFDVKDARKLPNLRFIKLRISGSSIFEEVAWFINYLNTDTSHQIGDVALTFAQCNFRSEEGQSILQQVFQCSIRLILWISYSNMLPVLILDESHSSYKNLNRIHVDHSSFEENPFPTLEKLPNLRILVLDGVKFPGNEIVCSSSGFPQLTNLGLVTLTDIQEWKMDRGAMPNLARLKLYGCINLVMLPDELRYISVLKTIEVIFMSEEFKNRVGVINGVQGEDFDKIRHVRNIIIHG